MRNSYICILLRRGEMKTIIKFNKHKEKKRMNLIIFITIYSGDIKPISIIYLGVFIVSVIVAGKPSHHDYVMNAQMA